MKDTDIRVITCGISGACIRTDYEGGVYEAKDGWLFVTHIDASNKNNPTRVLTSRIPLANIVQILEIAPKTPN